MHKKNEKKSLMNICHPSSFSLANFYLFIIDDKAIIAVYVDVVVALVLVLVVSFAVGVAPGIDDIEVPVDSFVADEGTTATKVRRYPWVNYQCITL